MASQIETPIYTRRTTALISSSADNNKVRCLGRATNQMRSGWRTLRDSLAVIPDIGTHPYCTTLSRTAWVRFNRLQTGVGCFRSCLRKLGMAL